MDTDGGGGNTNGNFSSDVITLNVGGKLFTTTRFGNSHSQNSQSLSRSLRSYTVKENRIGSAVSKILCYHVIGLKVYRFSYKIAVIFSFV